MASNLLWLLHAPTLFSNKLQWFNLSLLPRGTQFELSDWSTSLLVSGVGFQECSKGKHSKGKELEHCSVSHSSLEMKMYLLMLSIVPTNSPIGGCHGTSASLGSMLLKTAERPTWFNGYSSTAQLLSWERWCAVHCSYFCTKILSLFMILYCLAAFWTCSFLYIHPGFLYDAIITKLLFRNLSDSLFVLSPKFTIMKNKRDRHTLLVHTSRTNFPLPCSCSDGRSSVQW